jgi:DNA-binding transcriptional regulator YhcF (GntR family)
MVDIDMKKFKENFNKKTEKLIETFIDKLWRAGYTKEQQKEIIQLYHKSIKEI